MDYCFRWSAINAGIGYVMLIAGFDPKHIYNFYLSGAFLVAGIFIAIGR